MEALKAYLDAREEYFIASNRRGEDGQLVGSCAVERKAMEEAEKVLRAKLDELDSLLSLTQVRR
jgi:hypothetical protein